MKMVILSAVALTALVIASITVARAPPMTCAGYQEMSFRNPMRAAWMREQWQRSCRWTE